MANSEVKILCGVGAYWLVTGPRPGIQSCRISPSPTLLSEVLLSVQVSESDIPPHAGELGKPLSLFLVAGFLSKPLCHLLQSLLLFSHFNLISAFPSWSSQSCLHFMPMTIYEKAFSFHLGQCLWLLYLNDELLCFLSEDKPTWAKDSLEEFSGHRCFFPACHKRRSYLSYFLLSRFCNVTWSCFCSWLLGVCCLPDPNNPLDPLNSFCPIMISPFCLLDVFFSGQLSRMFCTREAWNMEFGI